MSAENSQVLFAPEAEAYIEALETCDIKDIGSSKWNQQHEYIEKLNMQAVLNASQQEDEFVKEFLITHDKISVLIHDLIVTETWKQNVFPELMGLDMDNAPMFPVYMVLFHEATVANLLETVLFHKEASENADDNVLDLVDYCYRKLTLLVSKIGNNDDFEESTEVDKNTNASNMEELVKQNEKLNFDICIKAVSILRYIIDALPDLPLSTTTRILNTHDIIILLVQLTESPPWSRWNEGKQYKYLDTKWQVIQDADRFKLSKIEGQVWLSLYQLLMSPDCQQKYEITPYRKNVILKLRAFLNEVMLDQMPVLGDLQRYLEQLSLMEPPPVKNDLILEQVPEIRDRILKENGHKWEKIAKKLKKTYFNPSKANMQEQAKRLADTYNFDVLEGLLTEPPKCALCGAQATKRCSRCQNEWYCRRECQVNHWKKHKKACDLLVDSLKKIAEQEQASGVKT